MYTKQTKHISGDQSGTVRQARKKNETKLHFEDNRSEALQLKSMQEKIAGGSNSGAPVQRMPDWIAKLIAQVGEHKLESFALAATAGFAGVLLYYYFNGKPTVRSRIEKVAKEEEPPDFSTLEGLARTIGVDPEKLEWQLEEAPEIDPSISLKERQKLVTVNDLYRKGFDPEKIAATGVVPPALLEDLPDNDVDKIEELFSRFNDLAFQYIGKQANGASGFLSRQGDCSTLALMFKLATQAAGINDVEIVTDPVPMLVPAARIHGRGSQRNVDGIACWAFVDHHWCTYKGEQYDLLFMNGGPDEVVHRQTGHVYNGVTYYVFEDGRAIIYEDMFNFLTASLTNGSEGRVFSSDDDAERYIDRYKK